MKFLTNTSVIIFIIGIIPYSMASTMYLSGMQVSKNTGISGIFDYLTGAFVILFPFIFILSVILANYKKKKIFFLIPYILLILFVLLDTIIKIIEIN